MRAIMENSIRQQRHFDNNIVQLTRQKAPQHIGNNGMFIFPMPSITPMKSENFVQNCRRGEKTEVYPLKKIEEIQAVSQWFMERGQHRDLVIFTLGLNIGLRAGDLLSLRVNDVFNADGTVRRSDDAQDTSDGISLLEEKTSKHRTFFLNEVCCEILEWYRQTDGVELEHGNYLFPSREGGHIAVDTFRKILKEAAKTCGIKQNIGTHTLRKTFGYWQFVHHSGDSRVLAMLQRLFGHSSQAMTLRYIGISDEENKRLYNEVCIRTIELNGAGKGQ